MKQGDSDWIYARCGRITASNMSALLARKADKTALCIIDGGHITERFGNGVVAERKAAAARAAGKQVEEVCYERGERSDSFWSLRDRIAAELLTGEPAVDAFENFVMRRGTELEPFARAEFECRMGVIVEEVGFIVHPRLDYCGCSPDGLLPDRGLEIKSPGAAVHMNTILHGMPESHLGQVMGCMWVCEKEKWDFCSYNPNFDGDLKLFVQTINIDYAVIRELSAGAAELWSSANELVERVRSKGSK